METSNFRIVKNDAGVLSVENEHRLRDGWKFYQRSPIGGNVVVGLTRANERLLGETVLHDITYRFGDEDSNDLDDIVKSIKEWKPGYFLVRYYRDYVLITLAYSNNGMYSRF